MGKEAFSKPAHRRRGKRERERARRQRRAEAKAAKGRVLPGRPPGAAPDIVEPVRGAEPAAIDPARRWYIARLLPRLGEQAVEGLKKAEVAVFQPRTSEVVVVRGRRVVRHAQLLMRTVFIGVRHPTHLDEACRVRGLAEIVSRPEPDEEAKGNVPGLVMRPARLDPVALQGFADAAAKGEIVRPMGVEEGSSVLVLVGPFASFPAVVETILPGDRLKLGVSIFGRCTPIEVGVADVKLV